ncbi:hypothetical protein ACF0H5_005498 [Mactra antiquata]
MAAPLGRPNMFSQVTNLHRTISQSRDICQNICRFNRLIKNVQVHGYSTFRSVSTGRKRWVTGVCAAVASSVFATGLAVRSVKALTNERPVSRSVKGIVDIGEQKFTLYQFQSCPYCCKVRATLDYFGFAYDVVEVNSVTKKQIKFSEYKKVPILVVDGKSGDSEFTLQFNDSSSIVSVLGSYVFDQTTPLTKLHTYYPGYKEKKGRKTVWDYPNKYFIMYGEFYDKKGDKPRNVSDKNANNSLTDDVRDERKWRKWTDDILMHTISPNVYRTPSESLEAFHHFSEWGEWDKNFSKFQQFFVVYVGALAMFFIGKLVKKRHNIKEDPRESLYDACDEWMEAVGTSPFLGGDQPNLADLSVYGALHSFEGCLAFNDLMSTHKVKAWYQRMEQQIYSHQGALLLKKSS